MAIEHISVCICTFKRPRLLERLLHALERQATNGLFRYSVVVADNDRQASARRVVSDFAAVSLLPVTYAVEERQNIALARNRALENAKGDFIAFVDDDEFPERNWLLNLFETCKAYGVQGVLGPVKPFFEQEPPPWMRKGGFFDRASHPTGYRVGWFEARTGNVLFRREILNGIAQVFRPEFGTAGEDVDFFRRMMEKGYVFVWCNEASVYEAVPPARCRPGYLLRRALLRGSNFPNHPIHRLRNMVKSVVAVPFYTLILPVLPLCGRHVFLDYLIRLLDHVSRLLAFLGWKLARERRI